MKSIFLLFAGAQFAGAVVASAADSQRAVIVSYPNDTPDAVLDQAKMMIKDAGGSITHEYNLIKAFAARAGNQGLDAVKSYGAKYNALVEQDSQVHANVF